MSLDFNNLFGPKPAGKLDQQPPRPLAQTFQPQPMAAVAPQPAPIAQSYTPGPPLPGAGGGGMDAGKAMKFLTALFGG